MMVPVVLSLSLTLALHLRRFFRWRSLAAGEIVRARGKRRGLASSHWHGASDPAELHRGPTRGWGVTADLLELRHAFRILLSRHARAWNPPARRASESTRRRRGHARPPRGDATHRQHRSESLTTGHDTTVSSDAANGTIIRQTKRLLRRSADRLYFSPRSMRRVSTTLVHPQSLHLCCFSNLQVLGHDGA